jgi:hypothetical protein
VEFSINITTPFLNFYKGLLVTSLEKLTPTTINLLEAALSSYRIERSAIQDSNNTFFILTCSVIFNTL